MPTLRASHTRKVPDGFVGVKQQKDQGLWPSRGLSLRPDIRITPPQLPDTMLENGGGSAVGFDPKPTVHDLGHCWFTNAVRSRVYPHIASAILGHEDKKKSLQALYLTISDEDLLAGIDMMKFDIGETEIRARK